MDAPTIKPSEVNDSVRNDKPMESFADSSEQSSLPLTTPITTRQRPSSRRKSPRTRSATPPRRRRNSTPTKKSSPLKVPSSEQDLEDSARLSVKCTILISILLAFLILAPIVHVFLWNRDRTLVYEYLPTSPIHQDDDESHSDPVNYLSLENGAKIEHFSPLPQIPPGRTLVVSRSTIELAFHDGPVVSNKCWWLPPPSGSGTVTLSLRNCIFPSFLFINFAPNFDMLPSKLSVWSDGLNLGEILWDSSVGREDGHYLLSLNDRGYDSCVESVTIYVTGHAIENSNGSCIHRIALYGDETK